MDNNIFEKAEKLYAAGFYDECANNVRKICEQHVDRIINRKGIAVQASGDGSPSLKDKIDALNFNLKLPENYIENYIKVLNYIRVIGNKGSHEQGGVTAKEAETALRYMKILYEKIDGAIEQRIQVRAVPYQSQQNNSNQGLSKKDERFVKATILMVGLFVIGLLLIIGGIITHNVGAGTFGFILAFLGSVLRCIIYVGVKMDEGSSFVQAVLSASFSDSYQSGRQLRRVRQNQLTQEQLNQLTQEQQNQLMQEQLLQHNQWAMEEARKSVTPFEMGGYDMTQGNSFNNNNFNNFNGF